MQDFKEFEQTHDTFVKDFKKISSIETTEELNSLEMRIVRTLQLMEAQIGYMGRGLYEEMSKRRSELARGIEAPEPEKKKPAKKKGSSK